VSDSSLRKDRRLKGALYAEAGIEDYWVVNVSEQSIEVYRDPAGDGYASLSTHAVGDTIALLSFPDVEVPVAEVFGG